MKTKGKRGTKERRRIKAKRKPKTRKDWPILRGDFKNVSLNIPGPIKKAKIINILTIERPSSTGENIPIAKIPV